jgi:hypothetical protein
MIFFTVYRIRTWLSPRGIGLELYTGMTKPKSPPACKRTLEYKTLCADQKIPGPICIDPGKIGM